MKTESELRTDLIAFLEDEIDDEDIDVAADTPLFSDGLIDSFAMAGLIAYVEELSGDTIPHSEVTLENFDTVDRIIAYIRSRAAAA